MKNSDSKSSISPDNLSETQNKKNNSSISKKENPSEEELRLVDEKNMVGQPMGNHIQNSNFNHQTPIDETNKKNFSEGDSNSMKEKLQAVTPPINVIESIKNKSGKS